MEGELIRDSDFGIRKQSVKYKMKKLYSLFWVRGKTLVNHVRRAPNFGAVWPWVLAGLVQTRLLKGEKVGKILIPLGKKRGEAVWLDLGSAQQRDVFQEVLVERNYPLERVPFKPSLIVDCGANVGYFSSQARVWFPDARLVAWEANAENFKTLKSQPALQGGKVELHHAAVSDREGEGFFIGEGAGGRLELDQPAADAKPVKVVDLRAWWWKNQTPATLWKIDVEGHERILLPRFKGGWIRPCALFLETHENYGNDQSLIKGIQKGGFRLISTKEHQLPGDPRVFREYIGIKE